jgi:hypothetical protein
MPERTAMKTTPPMRGLSEFIHQHGVRYKWVGSWPAIPVKLGPHDPDPSRVPAKVLMLVNNVEHFQILPPDAPPEWVDRIHERFFEKLLWFKNSNALKSIEFLDAAIYGFLYAASSVKRVGKLYENLPPTKGETPAERDLRRETRREQSEEDEQKNQELIRGMCESRLAEVRATWTPVEAAAYQKGFDYGAKCQRREEENPRPPFMAKVQIYQAMALNFREVDSLVQQGAAARMIGERIANRIVLANGMTKAQHFEKFPPKKKGEILTYWNGKKSVQQHIFTKSDLRIAERHSAKGKFLRLFEKICREVGIRLPKPGRPPLDS